LSRRKARTSITIPGELLTDLDSQARNEGRTRSDLVCEAVASYIAREEDRLLAEGYLEMAQEPRQVRTKCSSRWPDWWPEW